MVPGLLLLRQLLQERFSDHEEATEYFRQSLEIDTELARADPEDREKQWAMAQGHAWLSDAMMGDWAFLSQLSAAVRMISKSPAAPVLTVGKS